MRHNTYAAMASATGPEVQALLDGADGVIIKENRRLRQRIEELEREQPELIAIAIMQGQQHSADEIKLLREALSDLLSAYVADHPFSDDDDDPDCPMAARKARAALQGRAG